MGHPLKTTVLHRAAMLVGDAAQLQKLLCAAPEEFASWYSGEREPPEAAFLTALAVVLDDLDERDGA